MIDILAAITHTPSLTICTIGAMDSDQQNIDWKLKLRYGKLTTPYKHYTVIAEGVVGQLTEGFLCPPGNAFMSMKTWASSSEESIDMVSAIGRHIGFTVTGRVYVYDTEPTEPPQEKPFGYGIQFTPFDSGTDKQSVV